VNDGYDRLTTNQVARVAGVSVGSLYQYFPNKESLVREVFARHARGMLAMLSQAATDLEDVPLEAAVRGYVRAMTVSYQANDALDRVLMQQALHLGVDHLREVHDQAVQVVRSWLERHRASVLPTDLDTAAVVLVTACEAINHAPALRGQQNEHTRFEAEMCDLILRYLRGSASA
jgi:AcrR family transcriptional regulator